MGFRAVQLFFYKQRGNGPEAPLLFIVVDGKCILVFHFRRQIPFRRRFLWISVCPRREPPADGRSEGRRTVQMRSFDRLVDTESDAYPRNVAELRQERLHVLPTAAVKVEIHGTRWGCRHAESKRRRRGSERNAVDNLHFLMLSRHMHLHLKPEMPRILRSERE